MNLLKTMFCGLKTGSMGRLAYSGYNAFLFVIAIVLGCLFLFGGIAILAYLNLSVSMLIIGGGAYVIVSALVLYASIVVTIKRMRNIGFKRPILYFFALIIMAVLMVTLIEYVDVTGPVILGTVLNVLYTLFYVFVQLFLFLAPEGYIGNQKQQIAL